MVDRAATFIGLGCMDGRELSEGLAALLGVAQDADYPRHVSDAIGRIETPVAADDVRAALHQLEDPELATLAPERATRLLLTRVYAHSASPPPYVTPDQVQAACATRARPDWDDMVPIERAYALLLAAQRRAVSVQPWPEDWNSPPSVLATLPRGWEVLTTGGRLQARPHAGALPVISSTRGNDEAIFLSSVADFHAAATREIAELRAALAFIADPPPGDGADLSGIARQALETAGRAPLPMMDAPPATPGAIKRAMMRAYALLPDAVLGHPARMQWMGEHFLRSLGLLPVDHEPDRLPKRPRSNGGASA